MKNALFLQELLNSEGYKTLAAGGFVRDTLLNRVPKDIDLATEATPQQVIKILDDHNISLVPTGLKHGTITAILNKTSYEITTLRVDKQCKGREAEVEFVKSFEEDAKRRDLTINALFMDLKTKEIFDYVGGLEDLKNKNLRFVGDPFKRIQEDYLRLLRYARFISQLEFNADPLSVKACEEYIPYLVYISSERIRDELLKMIVGPGVSVVFHTYKKMIEHILPELVPTFFCTQTCQYHFTDVYSHTLYGVKHLAQYKNPILSLSHLLHDVAKPFCKTTDLETYNNHFYGHEIEGEVVADKVCQRLKLSSKDTNKVKFYVRNHMRLHQDLSKKALRRLLNDLAIFENKEEALKELYLIYEADLKGMKKDVAILPYSKIEEMLKEEPKSLSFESPLSGKEIMEHFSLKEGKIVGDIKEFLKEKVIEGLLDKENKEKSYELIKITFNYL